MTEDDRRIVSFTGNFTEHTFQDGSHSIEAQLLINRPHVLDSKLVDEIVEISSVCLPGFECNCGFTRESFVYDPSEPPALLIAHAIEHGIARRAAEKSLYLSKEIAVVVDGQIIMDKRQVGLSTPVFVEVKIRPKNIGDRIEFRVDLRKCLSESIAEIEGIVTKAL